MMINKVIIMQYNEQDKKEESFNNSLSRFVKDFACRNEVIAKFNNRKSISQIERELTYKISEESIIQMIWEYIIEKNIILLNDLDSNKNRQYDFIKKEGRFGKTYFERVSNNEINKNDYKKINIIKLKNDKTKLPDFEKELIEKLPFTKDIYYIKEGLINISLIK